MISWFGSKLDFVIVFAIHISMSVFSCFHFHLWIYEFFLWSKKINSGPNPMRVTVDNLFWCFLQYFYQIISWLVVMIVFPIFFCLAVKYVPLVFILAFQDFFIGIYFVEGVCCFLLCWVELCAYSSIPFSILVVSISRLTQCEYHPIQYWRCSRWYVKIELF